MPVLGFQRPKQLLDASTDLRNTEVFKDQRWCSSDLNRGEKHKPSSAFFTTIFVAVNAVQSNKFASCISHAFGVTVLKIQWIGQIHSFVDGITKVKKFFL